MAHLALCIGINNYPGTGMDLGGCINDALDWSAEFRRRGFRVETLLDADATRAAMLQSMRRMLLAAEPGDLVCIAFSGHGSFVFDVEADGLVRDESDGFDEALCPHDIEGGEPLTDDELHALFGERARGVRLLLIADSCHSGTVSRAAGRRARFLPPERWMSPQRLARAKGRRIDPEPGAGRLSAFGAALGRHRTAGRMRSGTDAPSDDVLFAGCAEGRRSFCYDAVFDGRPNGAFTFHALRALRTLPAGASYVDWRDAVTPTTLPSAEHPQTPQLVGDDAACRRAVLD
jgi:metacaspase-1